MGRNYPGISDWHRNSRCCRGPGQVAAGSAPSIFQDMWKPVIAVLLALGTMATAQEVSYAVRRAPEFPKDVKWLDKEAPVPHSVKGYRGQVVLIDFWEYTCINCIRDFGVVKRWYRKYHPYGLDIIGVHLGEFKFGFNPANIEQAARRFQLPWPVVDDEHASFWNAYKATAWPERYLIGPDGNIVMQVIGETNNGVMEQKIRELLEASHPEVKNVALDPPEATFAPNCGVPTQETYLGDMYGGGAVENAEGYHDDFVEKFKGNRRPDDGHVVLDGKWLAAKEGVTSKAADDSAVLAYHARSTYAVMDQIEAKKPVRVYLLQDGKPLTSSAAGVDVHFDGKGSYVDVDAARMYYLVKNPAFGAHLLTLEPQAAGFTLHSFTYGNNCQQDFDER